MMSVCGVLIRTLCCSLTVHQNDEQMSASSPVDSQFYRMLLEEGENMGDMMDAEEYLVPQPNLFPRTREEKSHSNGPSRHQSYRVSVLKSSLLYSWSTLTV